MKIVFFVCTLALLTGCSVQHKAEQKVGWLVAHDLLDDYAARYFPPKDSIVVRDSLRIDSLVTEGQIFRDTIPGKDSIVYLEHKCPPVKTIIKTIRKDSTIYQTDTKMVAKLQGDLQTKDKQIVEKDKLIGSLQKKVDARDWWKIACIISWCSIIVYFVIKKRI